MNKSEEQKSALENIKLFYESLEVVIKLLNDYSSIISKAKCKIKSWKRNSKYASWRR